jgi:CheY-like chemotaxis protein
MQRPDRTYLEVTVRPGGDRQLVAYVRNVTETVEQQRKLDALHQAGRELAGLDPDLLDEMNVPTRVELLKQNLRKSIRDLLHYDIIEVRLLDRRTGELKPLLEDGMTPEACRRVLYSQETGNGVTGYVAATGRSYLCPDVSQDPLYLEGASGAGSSMTVPLKYHDEVVGTLNVESPRTNGFGPDDLQFAELFSKEIAAALHTLDLLTAQQSCTAAQSVDAVNREVVLPVDEILGSAAVLLAKVGDTDPEVAEHLRRILAAARAVKENVRKVGRDMATGEPEAPTPLGGKRVLVVDADERARRSAHLLLGRLGAAVETAATASEGVALLAGSPFDAVLLDVKPPDMGGYEAYRRLRAARPEAAVAMMTGFGYDTAHSIVKARADGMRYVLFKPFRQDQLVKAVLDSAPLATTGMA